MASVATYLNFDRNCEEAFNYYKTVFGGEFTEPGFMRYGSIPPKEGQAPVPEGDKDLVMNVGLNILGGHNIMGSDTSEWMGQKYIAGNNVYVTLCPDSRDEADRLFNALSKNGTVEVPMQDMFWGDYYGSLVDKFGIGWMIATPSK